MKRWIKQALRVVVRGTAFLHRPVRRKLEATLTRIVHSGFDEVRLVMDDVVMEVFRLRNEVEELREELARARWESESRRPAA